MNFLFLSIPIITALTAWLVIHFFSKFVFFPINPVSIAGVRVQGILPAQQAKIATQLGNYAAQNFKPAEMLGKKLEEAASFEKFRPVIEEHLEEFLKHKLKDQIPMLSMLIGDKTIATIKSMFVKELENLFPKLTGKLNDGLGQAIDIKKMVEDKIRNIPPEQIAGAYAVIKKDLSKAKWLAFLFGLVAGMIQLAILCLAF